jgi:hypothetical protein
MARLLRVFAAMAVLTAVGTIALVAQSAKPTSARMADAANGFLQSLPPELRAKAAFAFDSPERVKWHFVPLQDNEQATTIMGLESLLAELEKNGTNVRNPNWYFVSIYGEPSAMGQWGWRVEGHHLSINVTLNRGEVISSGPTVFGSNPAEIKDGPRKGQRALPEIEDTARELIASFTAEQKKVAAQAKQFAEVDVKTRATVGEPVGLAAGKMTETQTAILRKLVEAYAGRMPGDVAAAELKKVEQAGFDKIHFGYCIEADKPGKPYTYRVHGPTFVVEFLNVQADSARNPANHIHSAWRQLPADFGLEK